MDAKNIGRLRTPLEFDRETGVSVRTLHHYDRLGLLAPAQRTRFGYRLYGDEQLERLEAILALRASGWSLNRIARALEGSAPALVVRLRMQREILARRSHRLRVKLDALDEYLRALSTPEQCSNGTACIVKIYRAATFCKCGEIE